MTGTEKVGEILSTTGAQRYGAECVSQLQHALQCAALAESDGATPALIAAALLHDIGHLIDNRFDGAAAAGVDRRHERIGSAFLNRWFGEEVAIPVALHVPAKRYLCAVDTDYFDTLFAGSVRSLQLQGGAFSCAEAISFVQQPYAKDAIRLRRWDEAAKSPDTETPPLDHFLCYVEVASNALPANVG